MLDFEDIKSRQTSPGMIFRLDDDSLHNYMTELKPEFNSIKNLKTL